MSYRSLALSLGLTPRIVHDANTVYDIVKQPHDTAVLVKPEYI